MAVVLPMTATAHHPSLRPRRPSATSWTPISSANSLSRRQDSIQLQTQHHQSMHSSSRTNRTRSASSRSRSPSSHSSQSSLSPRIAPNAHNRLGLSAVVGGGEALGLSLNGRRSGSVSGGLASSSVQTLGVHRTRRPRRRADEVERLYKCTWNGCEKSYGTLSHLNDHVRLQRHGNKREPHGEFGLLLIFTWILHSALVLFSSIQPHWGEFNLCPYCHLICILTYMPFLSQSPFYRI